MTESDTVMRVLERNAEISTRYGGGFVQSIEGLEAERARRPPLDWFFYVNGVESTGRRRRLPAARRRGDLVGLPRLVRRRCGCRPWSAPGRSRSSAATTASAHPVAVECLGGGAAPAARSRERLRARPASRSPARLARRRDPGPGRPLGAAARATRPRRRSRTARRRAASSPTSRGDGGGSALRGPRRRRRAGARLRPRRRPRRRHPPLRRAAGLGRDRRDGAAVRWPPRGLLDAADLRDHYAVAIEGRARRRRCR